MLGVGAVIVENFERIHRTNLIEMGVLPLTFPSGSGWKALGLTGREQFALRLPGRELLPRCAVHVVATRADGTTVAFTARCELHSATELEYYRAGGVLPYVMAHRFSK